VIREFLNCPSYRSVAGTASQNRGCTTAREWQEACGTVGWERTSKIADIIAVKLTPQTLEPQYYVIIDARRPTLRVGLPSATYHRGPTSWQVTI